MSATLICLDVSLIDLCLTHCCASSIWYVVLCARKKITEYRMIIFDLRMKQYLKICCLKYKEWNLETYELTFEILANTI